MAEGRRRGGGAATADAAANTDDFSEQMLACIQNCQDGHRACLQTLTYCMRRGGRHAAPDLLRLLMDCADVCLASASFMLRASDLHAHTCAACAAVCDRVADGLNALSDDPRMRAMTDTCRHCADTCRAMAGANGVGGAGTEVAAVSDGRPSTANSFSRGPRRAAAASVMSRHKAV